MNARAETAPSGLTVESGSLTWDGQRLEVLARRFGTPLYVVNRRVLSEGYARFMSLFQEQGLDARLFFPVKTNPVPEVVRSLVEEGAGVEVSSPLELRLVRDLGVPGSRITVCGTVKSQRFLEEAIDCRPALIVVESVTELKRLEAVARRGSPIHIALRLNPGLRRRRLDLTVTMGTEASPAGLRPGSREWYEALETVRSSPRMILRGLHCHIGTGISSGRPYREALDVILRHWVDLWRSGLRPTVLDIGGGFHTPSVRTLGLWEAARLLGWGKAPARPYDRGSGRANGGLLRDVAALCRERFDRLTRTEVEGHNLEPPRLFLEPGRSLSGSTQLLLLGVERVVERGHHPAFVLCDGGAMSLSLLLLSEYHDILAVRKADRAPVLTYDLLGSTPASLDIVGPGRKLPELEPGDVLAVLDVGAYFTSLGNNFGGPRAAIVMLDGSDVRLIRRRETYEDVFARDAFFASRPVAARSAQSPECCPAGRDRGREEK
jgi:diaminopimelate decarboxylase